jgi:hypothetical protein
VPLAVKRLKTRKNREEVTDEKKSDLIDTLLALQKKDLFFSPTWTSLCHAPCLSSLVRTPRTSSLYLEK